MTDVRLLLWGLSLSLSLMISLPCRGNSHDQGIPSHSPVIHSFAHRTGKPGCWAEFQTRSGASLCFSKNLWLQWLHSSQTPSLCETSDGRWKAFSRPNNEWITKTEPFQPFKPKPLLTRQTLQSLPSLSECKPSSFWHWNGMVKKIEKMREGISHFLKPHDPFYLFRKLILNEDTPDSPIPLIRRLGFVHLATASGIHLLALYSGIDSVTRFTFSWLRLSPQAGIGVSRVLSYLLCSFLWLAGGARLGMLRPWILILLKKVSHFLGFQWRRGSPLLCAVLIEGAIALFQSKSSPDLIQSTGRWVYVLAVGGSLFWSRSLKNAPLGAHFGLAVASWILVALWEIGEEGMMALGTPLFSLFSLSFFCVIGYPLLVFTLVLHEFGLTLFANSLYEEIARLLNAGLLFSCRIALLPGNLWILSPSFLLWGALFSCFLLILSWPTFRTFKRNALIFFLALGLWRAFPFSTLHLPSSSKIEAEKVEQLDVGQGDAALVFDPPAGLTRIGMIDTGSKHSLSDTAWLRLFAKRQIDSLSWIALTHLDEDHAGGLTRLLKLIPIRCVRTGQQQLQTRRGQAFVQNLAAFDLEARDWIYPCVPYPVLGPTTPLSPPGGSTGQNPRTKPRTKRTKPKGNEAMSAVLIPLSGGGVYLNMGDASAEDEIRMGQWASEKTESAFPRILKISHHGSRYSTSRTLLDLFKPSEAWISVGTGNRYGHPTVRVLTELKEKGIPIYRTDRDGSLKGGAALHRSQKPRPSPRWRPDLEKTE